MLYRILFILVFSAIAGTNGLFAQLKKADRFYQRYEYASAIPYYLKVIEKGKKGTNDATLRISDCYRQISDFEQAEKWYERAVEIEKVDPEIYLHYGQILRSNGKEEQAKEWLSRFIRLAPEDERGQLFLAFIDQVNNWEPDNYMEIVNMEQINSPYSEFGSIPFDDGIVFTSDRLSGSVSSKEYGWTGATYLDLFFSETYDSAGLVSFHPPRLFSEKINRAFHDGPAAFTDSNRVVYFTRALNKYGEIDTTRYYTNLLKIYYAEKKKEGWEKPKPSVLNNDTYSVGHPAFSPDGKILYFVSDMPGGIGGTDLYFCHMGPDGLSAPQNLGNVINSIGNEMFPFILNDSVLYFASDGHPGYGGLDLFVARNSAGEWQKPQNLMAPINSPADDFSMHVFHPDSLGLFSSNRPGGLGKDDIYLYYPKPRPLPKEILLAGKVRERDSGLPAPGAYVFLWDKASDKVRVLRADEEGRYAAVVGLKKDLQIKGMRTGFLSDTLIMSTGEYTGDSMMMASRDLWLGKLKIDQTFRFHNIYYDFDKWFIRSDAAAALQVIITFLNEHPEIHVELGAHTDCRGSDAYNQRLSEKRAQSAVDFIVEAGVDASRITARGYGELQLINECDDRVPCSEAKHQQNRRTEIKVTGVMDASEFISGDPLSVYEEGQELALADLDPDFFNLLDQEHEVKSMADAYMEQYNEEISITSEPPVSTPKPPEDEIVPLATASLDQQFTIQVSFSVDMPVRSRFNHLDHVIICQCEDGYRVFTGLYTTRQAANEALGKVRATGFKDAWPTIIDSNRCKCGE